MENNSKKSHKLDENFKKINECYEKFISKAQNSQSGCDFKLVSEVWNMLEKSEYWGIIYDDNPNNNLSVEIHEAINKCIENYPAYKKKNVDVPFSRFLYYHLKHYVFKPYISTIKYMDKFSVKKSTAKKLHQLDNLIDKYFKTNGFDPDFSNPEIVSQFAYDIKVSEKRLVKLLEVLSRNTSSLDASNEEDISLHECIEDEKNIDSEELIQVLDETDKQLKIIQEQWKTIIKSSRTRQRVSALFTWYFIKNSNIPAEAIIYKLMYKSEILDKELIRRFYNGEYRESFEQKDIAKELGIDNTYANHLLHRDFLDKIIPKYNKNEVGLEIGGEEVLH